MREIILDTETTGLDPAKGDRLVEIGAVELINHVATGNTYHAYINPERMVPAEARAVHGLSDEFLKDKPVFAKIVDEFLAFIGDAPLVIHNASFDTAFLNAELSYVGRERLDPSRVIDTLAIARKKFPMAPASLDALCKRFNIDVSKRTKHGALLDSELLALVYLELVGGRQISLTLAGSERQDRQSNIQQGVTATRPVALPPRLTEDELEHHRQMVESLGPKSLWIQSAG